MLWPLQAVIMGLIVAMTHGKKQYYAKPIEVSASLHIENNANTTTKDMKSSANRDYNEMEVGASFLSLKKTRPRPYLNAQGQIEFYQPIPKSTEPPKRSHTYHTTMRANHLLMTKSTVIPLKPTVKPSQTQDVEEGSVPSYKPTFKPSVILAQVANVEISSTTAVPSSTETSTTTVVDEKIDLTSTLNQLSSNSLVNLLVVFGLPTVTALLSFMGAGPLAIASVAWLIPIAAFVLLPDLRRGVSD